MTHAGGLNSEPGTKRAPETSGFYNSFNAALDSSGGLIPYTLTPMTGRPMTGRDAAVCGVA